MGGRGKIDRVTLAGAGRVDVLSLKIQRLVSCVNHARKNAHLWKLLNGGRGGNWRIKAALSQPALRYTPEYR
jgi:hypothetical protein